MDCVAPSSIQFADLGLRKGAIRLNGSQKAGILIFAVAVALVSTPFILNFYYQAGYNQALQDSQGNNYNIRNPTYTEALQFTATDQTDKNIHNEETYTCTNFAADFKNNAFDAGYQCGYVEIVFVELAHAIVCFNTTDQGLIFIEPQDDQVVTLKVGTVYWDRTIYETPDFDDTVVRYTIVW